MARRKHIVAFGSAAVLVVVGALCSALVGGLTGEVLAIALITLGLGGALLLGFLEIGLSEDRARARDEERRSSRRGGAPRQNGAIRPRQRPRRRR